MTDTCPHRYLQTDALKNCIMDEEKTAGLCEKARDPAVFCVAMHLQELSAADVLLSVQVLGYTVPVITRVLVPGMTLHAPVSAFWVNVAAGTVISPALVVKSPVV